MRNKKSIHFYSEPGFLYRLSKVKNNRNFVCKFLIFRDTESQLNRMNSRRSVRETVLKALYARQLGGHDDEDVIAGIINDAHSDDKEGLEFATKLYLRTVKMADDADEQIRIHVANWELNRLAILDRLILRMAVSELLTFEDIPPKVTINEAIEMAKKYSTGKSGRFVNGILDATLESLESQNRIVKKGRGLIDRSTDTGTKINE